jgi:hypothetical protein
MVAVTPAAKRRQINLTFKISNNKRIQEVENCTECSLLHNP